jgi:beta-lactam-binding protein with PASTA domain
MDRDRTSDTEETIVERVERVEAPPPPSGDAPEREEAVVHESETIRSRPDGAIERDTVRHEDRRRSPREHLAAWLALLLLLVLGGLAAAWYFTQEETREVPSVEGLRLEQAVSRLQDDGFRTDIVTEPNEAAQGTVFAQDPAGGTEADEGSTVEVRVSGGPETTSVPNAVGLAEAEARDRLVAAGFQVETREVFSEREPGTVVSQSPSAGADAEDGATVTLEVSKGTGLVDVPNVVGLQQADAEAELSSVGLEANVVEVPSAEPEGTVVAQNPTGGQAREGSSVRLNVSQGV